jgi:hypothetical protein
MLRPWLIAAAASVIAAQAQAQSRWQNLENTVKSSAGDAWDVWTSPLRGTAKDWLGAAGAIGASAAVSPLDDDVDRWAVNHTNDRAFDFLKPVRPGGWAFFGRSFARSSSIRSLRALVPILIATTVRPRNRAINMTSASPGPANEASTRCLADMSRTSPRA